jgi:hypothetical protein
MPWKEPHLRRLPTAAEYNENKQRIQELDAIITTLTNQLRALQTERDNRCSFIAPFRYLPQEILAEIASECVQLRVSPHTLSNVCKSLREAVIDMSFLWNKILLKKERAKEIFDDMYDVSTIVLHSSPSLTPLSGLYPM